MSTANQFCRACLHNWRICATLRECLNCGAREIRVGGRWVPNPQNEQEEAA